MSQNQKKSIIRTSYHVFQFWGKTVNPKERAAVSPCCYGEPVTLLDSLFPTEEHPDLGICCSGHSEKHACDIAAGEREGSFSIQVDSPTELWQSGGTSLGWNDTCEVYHQSPEKNGLIQSVFTMPLLSLYLTEVVIYSTVSRSAPALVMQLIRFWKELSRSICKGLLLHFSVMYFFFISLYVLQFLQLSVYVLFVVEKWCEYIQGIANIFQFFFFFFLIPVIHFSFQFKKK